MSRWPQARSRGRPPELAGARPLRRDRHPERERGRRRSGSRTRRDRRRAGTARSVPYAERMRLALEDLATYRTVAFRDLSDHRFDGHDFVARRALSQLEAAGHAVRGEGTGPRGEPFVIWAATPEGARAARARGGRDGQRYWSGLVKPGEAHHDVAIYRAATERIDAIEREGGRAKRVRIDAELKSELAKASERARAKGGAEEARKAQHARARELGLPVRAGKVHVPDAVIDYERPGERGPARASIEVVTKSYKADEIRAKQAMGFQLAASGSAAARHMRSALGSRGGGGLELGDTEGRGGGGRPEEWDF